MQVQIVKDAHPLALLVRLHLPEIPGNEGGIAVGLVIRADAAAVQGGVEIGAPPPEDRPQGSGGGVRRLDRGGVPVGAVTHLVIGGRLGMDVAMGAVPEHRLIVQIVVGHTAVRGLAVLAGQMFDPARHEIRAYGSAGVGSRIAGDGGAVRIDPVAAVGVPRVHGLLLAVSGNPETAAVGMVAGGVASGGPAEERHGHDRLRTGAPILIHEQIGSRSVLARVTVRNVFKIPVHAGVVDVRLPVVAARGVPSPAPYREP